MCAVAGGVAGICGWLIIYPLDAVKTRIQVLLFFGGKGMKIKSCFKKMKGGHMRIHLKKKMASHIKKN